MHDVDIPSPYNDRLRFWMWVFIGLLFLGACVGAGWDWSRPNPTMVTPSMPDPRVRWEIHPVGGFILKRPGVKAQMALPDGTLLYIPRPAKYGYADSTSHSS